jgi:hypothetical protein
MWGTELRRQEQRGQGTITPPRPNAALGARVGDVAASREIVPMFVDELFIAVGCR